MTHHVDGQTYLTGGDRPSKAACWAISGCGGACPRHNPDTYALIEAAHCRLSVLTL